MKIKDDKQMVGNLRWSIALLLFFATGLNYIDRNTLAILASTIQSDLGFSDNEYSKITAAFVMSYTIMYSISGGIVDKIGTRKTFILFTAVWSLITAFHSLAKNAMNLLVLRLFLGVSESAVFPAGIKGISEWFPIKERALAIGIFNAGAAIGSVIAIPIVSYLAFYLSWKFTFIITGFLGFIWLFFWIRHYFLPSKHPKISESEKSYILSGSVPSSQIDIDSKSFSLIKMFKNKRAWGCFSARIFIDPVTYFLFFWIPKFLQDYRGFSLADVGMLVWLPYLGMGVGTILGGLIPKVLITRFHLSIDSARKIIMLIASVLVPLFCFLLYWETTKVIAIFSLVGIMFGHGLWSNITLPAETFPNRMQGVMTGMGGTLGGITGFLSQYFMGSIVTSYSYLPIFIYVGVVYMFTLMTVHYLIGKLGEIKSL